MDRRSSIRALFGGLAVAVPCLARSQPADRMARVGILRPAAAPSSPTNQMAAGIPTALRELGYVEGRNLIVEQRGAGGDPERLPVLARELLQAKIDVIVTVGAQVTRAVLQATVPVVMYGNLDPVALGLVASLARPGGLLAGAHTHFVRDRLQIIELAARHRLPAMYEWRKQVEDGGLMAYSTSLNGLYRRVASCGDRILKGARPADLPLEQPTKFELVINQKTAKALGLTIPQSLLLRADEGIQ